jgi:hypothetical protein
MCQIMYELFATGCEESMFNIVLNMHELFDSGRDETMFAIEGIFVCKKKYIDLLKDLKYRSNHTLL